MSWNYGNTPELYKEVEILLKKWNYSKRHDDQR